MIKFCGIALSALVMAFALSAGLAIADDGHDHDHDHGAKHNGIIGHSGHHHLELVAAGGTIDLYVTHEDGDAEDVSGAKATATVLADGKTEVVTLAPANGNALKGTGSFNAGKGTTVVVSLTMPGHETEQIRFKLEK
jgi:hypothetical protein